MKCYFAPLLLVLLMLPCVALTDYVPQRDEFTFSTTVMASVNEEEFPGECMADSILLYITDGRGNTEVRTVWAEPLDTLTWQGFGTILEEDINFDGYADLMVCNGPVNMFGNFTYTAFLWDQSAHAFSKTEVEGFDRIFDPEIYAAEKQIVGVWRLDDDLDINTYKWDASGKLVLVKSEHHDYSEMAE